MWTREQPRWVLTRLLRSSSTIASVTTTITDSAMMIWEVRLAHDDDNTIHVGSIYAWNSTFANEVKQMAVHRFGDHALAVRPSRGIGGLDHEWDSIKS